MLTLRYCNHLRNVVQGIEPRSLFSLAGQLRFRKHENNVLLSESGIPYKADRFPKGCGLSWVRDLRHRCGDETLSVSRVDVACPSSRMLPSIVSKLLRLLMSRRLR